MSFPKKKVGVPKGISYLASLGESLPWLFHILSATYIYTLRFTVNKNTSLNIIFRKD